ncbi:MAG: OB-fold nucleic acid binding domain-containing protein [Candidatus Altiarchaeota archaeon]|nr:OB-fold nucleic acid binding domain-containing protein [Candidatus Altiarchaeota archaeon]
MDDVEELVKKVSSESGKSAEEIKKKIAERKEKTHGLLSDYGALYAVAKEYGIDLNERELQATNISELKPLSSVNVIGKVKTVFSAREFTKKDGSNGKFASAVIIDETGETRIVMWDQNSDVVKKLHIGDILLVKNGYVKDNQGRIEVHAGGISTLTVNPPNVKIKLPEIEEKIDQIKSLNEGNPGVNIICRVTNLYPSTEFSRADGSTGKRASFTAQDESGTIRVVLWDNATSMEMKEGDIIKIENGYTRTGLNSEVELQAGNKSRIIKSDAKLKLPKLEPSKQQGGLIKIAEITPDIRNLTVEARVMKVYEPREYSKGSMASLVVGDATGTTRVVLWDDKSAIAKELSVGDSIRIKNAYSRANMNNEPEVHVGKFGEITVDSTIKVPSLDDISISLTEEKKIADLEINDRFIKVTGKIVDIEDRPLVYMTCPECNKKTQNLGGEWMCESCGMIDPNPNMVASIVVEDDTGNIRAIAFKDKAEKIMGMDIEEAMNMIGETQDEGSPLKQVREKLAGKKITLTGKVNYNDFSDQLEFIIDEVI